MHVPHFHFIFQAMIFAALLESGTGAVHARNERIANIWRSKHGSEIGPKARGIVAVSLLIVCMFIAQRFGLVALIANGYRVLACVLIAINVLPPLTVGIYRLTQRSVVRAESL